ncbi:MAG TPA: hypothetical protein VFQ77_04185 [Pseudonocardiaceae bacterium]|jgi:hypothetical protein|nr:hypothetical protein [Pseudonocardiaceae bacterium]
MIMHSNLTGALIACQAFGKVVGFGHVLAAGWTAEDDHSQVEREAQDHLPGGAPVDAVDQWAADNPSLPVSKENPW